MRHKDVLLCPIGALALYLALRFELSNEFKDGFVLEDWLDNSKWFDVKLLVDVWGTDTTKAMKNDTYANAIKEVLTFLKIVSNHWVHLGRKILLKTRSI